MKKTIAELRLELSQSPENTSFRLLSLQEQDACKGQGSNYSNGLSLGSVNTTSLITTSLKRKRKLRKRSFKNKPKSLH